MIEEFGKIVKKSMRKAQKEFDVYQKANFPYRSPEFFCLELNGEAGELANFQKKRWKGRKVEDEAFEDEAADVLIALMNYCNAAEIDLGKAVQRKLKIIDEKVKKRKKSGQEY